MAEINALFAWAHAHQLAEWMLVLLTAALAFVTWRLVVETRCMARDAAVAAGQDRQVAKDANRIAMAGITAANRAWVAIENVLFDSEDGRIAFVNSTLKNYGSVPAVNVAGTFLAMIVGTEVEDLWHSGDGSPSDLFPGVPRVNPITLPITSDTNVWNDVLVGKRTFFIGISTSYSFPGNVGPDQRSSGVFQYNAKKKAFHTRSRRLLDDIPPALHAYLQ